MAVDWSSLPPDLLEMIARRFNLYIDFLRFRFVCQNWRSAVPKKPHHLPCQVPWLMLPVTHRKGKTKRGFYSLPDNKIRYLDVPEASYRKRCCGSSQGWLVIVDESPEIRLFNPLTRAQIVLPPLTKFPNVSAFDIFQVGKEYLLQTSSGDCYTRNLKEMRDLFIRKVILSSNPSADGDFIALAILNETGDIAFCEKGDEAWKFIEDAQSYSEDVIFTNGLFYAVNKRGNVAVCDVRAPCPMVTIIETAAESGGDMRYLVSLFEELLLVTRYLDLEFDVAPDIVYKTNRFEVSKLDSSGSKWVNVKSLGDFMLFLGENSSLSLPAFDFPTCKGNRIYFTDDYSESNYDGVRWDYDLGVFNLEDGSIEPLPCCPRNSRLIPIWVTPNPC